MKNKLIFGAKSIGLLFLTVLLFCYAMFQGGFVSWFIFYAFLPVIVYTLAFMIYPLSSWRAERKAEKISTYAGSAINMKVTIRRSTPFPLPYLVVEDLLPASLMERNQSVDFVNKAKPRINEKQILFPWFKKEVHFQYTLDNLPRGKHELEAIRLRTGDLFHLISKEIRLDVTTPLTVYPNSKTVHLQGNFSAFEEGAAVSRQLASKNTNTVSSIREYTPGDRFSWIDWKASARKNSMMTKEFDQEKSADVHVVLDASANTEFYKPAFDFSVELAYSMYNALSKRAEHVNLLVLDQGMKWFTGHRGASKSLRVQEYLTTMQQNGTETAGKMAKELQKLPKGSIIYYVTTEADGEAVNTFRQLRYQGYKCNVMLVRPKKAVTIMDERFIKELQQEGHAAALYTEKHKQQKEIEVISS